MPNLLQYYYAPICYLSFFCLILLTSSCEDKKKKEAISESFQLKGQFLIHQPHCGGRPARKDQANQQNPYKYKDFVVKKGKEHQDDSEVVAHFKTDAEGKFDLELPKGNYCIIKATKNMSYADFYNKYQSPYDSYYQPKEEGCFKEWWSSCELSIALDRDTTLSAVTLFNKCFVGENPCMLYEGPLPP